MGADKIYSFPSHFRTLDVFIGEGILLSTLESNVAIDKNDKPGMSFLGLMYDSEAIDDLITKIEDFEFDICINVSLNSSFKDGYELNNKYFYIKIIFDNEQNFADYWKYYEYVTELLTFCLGYKDIRFKVKLLDYMIFPGELPKIKSRRRMVKRIVKCYGLEEKKFYPVMGYNFYWSSKEYKAKKLNYVILLDRLN